MRSRLLGYRRGSRVDVEAIQRGVEDCDLGCWGQANFALVDKEARASP